VALRAEVIDGGRRAGRRARISARKKAEDALRTANLATARCGKFRRADLHLLARPQARVHERQVDRAHGSRCHRRVLLQGATRSRRAVFLVRNDRVQRAKPYAGRCKARKTTAVRRRQSPIRRADGTISRQGMLSDIRAEKAEEDRSSLMRRCSRSRNWKPGSAGRWCRNDFQQSAHAVLGNTELALRDCPRPPRRETPGEIRTITARPRICAGSAGLFGRRGFRERAHRAQEYRRGDISHPGGSVPAKVRLIFRFADDLPPRGRSDPDPAGGDEPHHQCSEASAITRA